MRKMREILFRGKRIDNDDWVEGSYWNNWLGDHFIRVVTGVWGNCYEDYAVDPDTVGQFTGLTDKNGKKIFEGDVVRAGSEGLIANCEVKRRIDGIYYMNPNKKAVWYMVAKNDGITTVEIVGNRWDNPELLGGVPNA